MITDPITFELNGKVQSIVPKIKKLVLLRHMHGYSDEAEFMYRKSFQYYQVIGCRHQPACLTPSASRNESVPYYRPYSEPKETRLYFRGFNLDQLRQYVATFNSQSNCDICTTSSVRRIVPCSKF